MANGWCMVLHIPPPQPSGWMAGAIEYSKKCIKCKFFFYHQSLIVTKQSDKSDGATSIFHC